MQQKRVLKVVMLLALLLLIIQFTQAATRTFYVKETEFVKIVPTAIDQDNDKINYTYSPPLDAKGEWQTTYNDAGDYNITITASDGKEQTTENIHLIVENKNQPPQLTSNKLTVIETQKVSLKDLVEDADGDPLTFTFPEPFNEQGVWQTTYDDSGDHIFTFTVSDGEFTQKARIEVKVEQRNAPPTITKTFSSSTRVPLKEGETLNYYVESTDPDNQPLQFLWTFDNKTINENAKGNLTPDFESAGDHLLSVSVNDALITTNKNWTIQITNVNRKPQISHIPITVSEGEKVTLDLPQFDQDGDPLTYTYDKPLSSQGEWQTNYESSGTYNPTVTASDGILQDTTKISITVLDVDRAPTLSVPQFLVVNEDQLLNWTIDVIDPDNDNITITIKNLPEGATVNQKTKSLHWRPGYDFIARKQGAMYNLLSTLRLDQYLLKEKDVPLEIEACGREWCSVAKTTITVTNINRGPTLNPMPPVSATETQTLVLAPQAHDEDGDIIHYYYTKPIHKTKGTWQTTYDDQGEYTSYITATDGRLSQTVPVAITILKKNRAPTIQTPQDEITINEGEQLSFGIDATDPDQDPVKVIVSNPPQNASLVENTFTWQPSYDTVTNRTGSFFNNLVSNVPYLNKKLSSEKTTTWIELSATDQEANVTHPIKVTVKNVNRAPTIQSVLPGQPVTLHLNEPMLFNVQASDSDKDNITYTWSFSGVEATLHASNSIERTFVSPGSKTVTVTLDDGRDKTTYTWHIEVLNEFLTQTIQTNETYNIYVIDY